MNKFHSKTYTGTTCMRRVWWTSANVFHKTEFKKTLSRWL